MERLRKKKEEAEEQANIQKKLRVEQLELDRIATAEAARLEEQRLIILQEAAA